MLFATKIQGTPVKVMENGKEHSGVSRFKVLGVEKFGKGVNEDLQRIEKKKKKRRLAARGRYHWEQVSNSR